MDDLGQLRPLPVIPRNLCCLWRQKACDPNAALGGVGVDAVSFYCKELSCLAGKVKFWIDPVR